MPSSNKTVHLALNKWIGSDKPKMDDFNNDNAILDTACRNLAQQVSEAVEAASGSSEAVSAHVADTSIHVTAEEKAMWSSGGNGGSSSMVFGTYVGNGAISRSIQVEQPIRFGMLYAVGKGQSEADWGANCTRVYYGYFGKEGCSRNITLNGNGFTVMHTLTMPPDGCMYKYNETDVTYVYLYWPDQSEPSAL